MVYLCVILVIILESLNRLDKADKLYREDLNLNKTNLLSNDPTIGEYTNNLAKVLISLNRYKEAYEINREAQNLIMVNLLPNHLVKQTLWIT